MVSVQHGCISIHALLAESDLDTLFDEDDPDISIHALLAESDLHEPLHGRGLLPISIHALLAESDNDVLGLCEALTIISIHALLAESDIGHAVNLHPKARFLSTLSLRRATCVAAPSCGT